MSLLTVANLAKSYVQGRTSIEILRDVSLDVEPGETVAILGESGSGKSTLLALLSGLDRPDAGSIQIAKTRIDQLDEAMLTQFRGQEIGIVFQQFHLMSTLNALENVMLPLDLRHDCAAVEKARAILARMGLSHREAHLPHQLSGGECQRVAIARAFVTSPTLLLADEPSGNLDTRTGNMVMESLFNEVSERKMTMILVTHNEALSTRCTRQVWLSGGELRANPS